MSSRGHVTPEGEKNMTALAQPQVLSVVCRQVDDRTGNTVEHVTKRATRPVLVVR